MSDRQARFDNMLFNYESTVRTDFRDGEIEPIIKTVYKSKPTCVRVRPPPLKDLHALTDWRVPNVPFNLMHKPKEIVQTSPWQTQKPYFQHVDSELKKVQKTRPRLVMTPGAVLDNATDSDRELLVKDIYMTSLMKMVRDSGTTVGDNVRAPLSPVYAPADPLALEKLKAPYVSPEWRMDSAAWDSRQLRTYCNPNRYFWLARTPKCDVCKETSEREAKRKLRTQQL